MLETNTDDCRSSSTRVTARARGARRCTSCACVHPIIGVERDGTGGSPAVAHAARRAAPRVGHALRPRPPARRRASWRELEAAVRDVLARRARTSSRDFAAMTERVDDDDRGSPAAAAARYDARRGRARSSTSSRWLLRGNFVLLGAREYDFTRRRDPRRPRLRPRASSPTRTRSAYAQPVPLDAAAARRRASARTSGDLLLVAKTNARLAGAPPRADGLRRRAAASTPDGEIVGESRLLGLFTTQGLRRAARPRRPLLHRKLRQRARRRGPDRGLARLQGRGRAVRLVPEGRAVRRAGRRPAPRRRRAAGARGHRPRPAARAPRARRAQRLADPRRCRATRYGALLVERDAQAVRARASAPTSVEAHHVLGRGRARARALPRPRAGRAARGRRRASSSARSSQLARTWDDELRDALAERHGAVARAPAGRAWAAPLPRPLQGLHGAASSAAIDIALLRAAGRGRSRSWSRCSRSREASRRASRSTSAAPKVELSRGDADARGPRAARDRGDLDAAARRRRDLGAGVPRARARTASRSTSTRSATAWPRRSPPSTAATPSRTRSTGS